jgi:hypothetical protein
MSTSPHRQPLNLAAVSIVLLVTWGATSLAVAQPLPSIAGSRMFPAAHRQVWNAVTAELNAMGIKLESSDPATGVFVTRSYVFSSSGKYPRPKLENPMLHAESIVLHGFVSPYSAPTRLYVTSFVFATSATARAGQIVRLQGTGAEEPLLERVSSRLGLAGEPVFKDREQRRMQALRVLDRADGCLSRPDAKLPIGPRGLPRKLNDVAMDYPVDMVTDAQEGYVRIEADVSEDGSVAGAHILTTDGQRRPPQTSFEMSVAQMMLLTRFEPLVVEGCPTPVTYKRQVSFSLK